MNNMNIIVFAKILLSFCIIKNNVNIVIHICIIVIYRFVLH